MAELSSQPTSVQSIYNWYRENKLYVNRRYQRKLVWTLEEKQKLIDSILKKYPVPAILLAEKEGNPGEYEIIDGLQRLHAILSFVETSLSDIDGKYFNLSAFPTAKANCDAGIFEDGSKGEFISSKDVSTLLDYSLAISVMRNAAEAEINDVFDRINTYGHRLSDQERRQAGVQTQFATMVREIACSVRGDVSTPDVLLYNMPSISIDLPKSSHGYSVQAEEVFWVNQGILRSTDLRDSMDEQCIADIASCIIGPNLIERSKEALDEIYDASSAMASSIQAALDVHGSDRFADEFNYCVQEIIKVCTASEKKKLRSIIFERSSTNPFPAVFAVIVIAFHEILIKEKKKIADYGGVAAAISNLTNRIETSRKATLVDERRKNIDQIKGLVQKHFVKAKEPIDAIYKSHTVIDIDGIIRRSEIELSNYELKQGMIRLDGTSKIDDSIIGKVITTISAIANIGPKVSGRILIGVVDKESDAERIKKLDSVEPRIVGKRHVVGINREAKRLGKTTEQYVALWRDEIKNSALTEALKNDVLSNIDYNSYYGLGLLVIAVPPQKAISYVGDNLYWRNGDSTEPAVSAKLIASIVDRFK
jgi:hypothetical protein